MATANNANRQPHPFFSIGVIPSSLATCVSVSL